MSVYTLHHGEARVTTGHGLPPLPHTYYTAALHIQRTSVALTLLVARGHRSGPVQHRPARPARCPGKTPSKDQPACATGPLAAAREVIGRAGEANAYRARAPGAARRG